jgi:hypothetical protein
MDGEKAKVKNKKSNKSSQGGRLFLPSSLFVFSINMLWVSHNIKLHYLSHAFRCVTGDVVFF